MTLQEFHAFLSGIDWDYPMSDFYQRWEEHKGLHDKARLLAVQSPQHAEMLAAFETGERPECPVAEDAA